MKPCRNGCVATAGQAKHQANTIGPRATPRSQRLCGLWLGSSQPGGLKPFVDFCLAVSRRARPSDCFAGYDAAPAARRCGVARSGETAADIDSLAPARLALTGLPTANLHKPLPQLRVVQHSRLQKSANALQRPSWDLISGSQAGRHGFREEVTSNQRSEGRSTGSSPARNFYSPEAKRSSMCCSNSASVET